MKKKIFTCFVAALLVTTLSVPAFADSVITTDEAVVSDNSASVSNEIDAPQATDSAEAVVLPEDAADEALLPSDAEDATGVKIDSAPAPAPSATTDDATASEAAEPVAQTEAEAAPSATTSDLQTASSSTTYKIIKSVNGASYGSIMVIGDNATLYPKAGAKVRFRTSPKTGYTLTRMSYTNASTGKTIALTRIKGTGKAGTNSEYEFTMPAGNVTLNATFGMNKRNVTTYWTADGSLRIVNSADGTKASKYPQVGKKVTLHAPVKEGYRLVRMSYILKSTGKAIAIPKVKGTTNYYAFTMPNEDVEVHADFSAGKYYYEVYDVSMYANIYSGCLKPLFIKTNNPNPSAIRLWVDGASTGHSYSSTYDDVVSLDNTNYDGGLYRVEGGYFVSFAFPDPNNHVFEIAENVSETSWDFKAVSTYNVSILDYEATRDQWWQSLIDKYTTPDMTKTEKMGAVCNYLLYWSGFKYPEVSNGKVVHLATMAAPYLDSKRWNSYSSPAALCTLAQKIGFADEDIHNCYGDYPVGSVNWQNTHYYCKVREKGEWTYFYVCPDFSTGEIGNYPLINFNNTSAFHSWMKSN